MIHVHRKIHFQWRSQLTKTKDENRILGNLARILDEAYCASVPASDNHHQCSPVIWQHDPETDPKKQGRQLLAEHRRLVRNISSIREPMEQVGEREMPRDRTAYEDLIIEAWDNTAPVPTAVDAMLAEYVHDSVAHFTSWPCALQDQRGIFCHKSKYFALVPESSDTERVAASQPELQMG